MRSDCVQMLQENLHNKRTLLYPSSLRATRSYGAKRPLEKVVQVFFSPRNVVFMISYLVFRVPTTHDVLTTLFHPGYPKSHLDLFNLGLLALQLLLFFFLPRATSQVFFFVYFAFWRGMYDLGLGWVLTKQSKKKWIVRQVRRLGWLDGERRPRLRKWIREQLVGKMGKDYEFDVGYVLVLLFEFIDLYFTIGTAIGIQHMAIVPSGRRYHSYQVSPYFYVTTPYQSFPIN
jgi:hypothetical protein